MSKDKYEALREAIKGATPRVWMKSKIWQGWSKPYREDALTSSAQLIADENGAVVAMAVTCFEGWNDAAKTTELNATTIYIAAANPKVIEQLLAERDALRKTASAFIKVHDDYMKANHHSIEGLEMIFEQSAKAMTLLREALKKAEEE